MPKTNSKSGEVDLPGFGELRFDLVALEALEETLGPNWLPTLHDKLGGLDLKTIKTCLEIASAHWQDTPDYAILSKPGGLSKAVDAIHDAISYSVFGKSHAELLEEAETQEAERIAKKMQKLEENPLLAAAFLRELGLADTKPDSDPPKSEDSPQ